MWSHWVFIEVHLSQCNFSHACSYLNNPTQRWGNVWTFVIKVSRQSKQMTFQQLLIQRLLFFSISEYYIYPDYLWRNATALAHWFGRAEYRLFTTKNACVICEQDLLITDKDSFPAAALDEPEAAYFCQVSERNSKRTQSFPILLYSFSLFVDDLSWWWPVKIQVLAMIHRCIQLPVVLTIQLNHIPIHHERAAELGKMPKNQASIQKHEMTNQELWNPLKLL